MCSVFQLVKLTCQVVSIVPIFNLINIFNVANAHNIVRVFGAI